MIRLSLAAVLWLSLLASAAVAQDDDPTIDGKKLSELIKQLRSENRGFQLRAAKALSAAPTNLYAQIVPLVTPLLKSERENDKFVAAQVLGDYGPVSRVAVPDLMPMLKGTQYERNRAAAAKALGQILRDAKPDKEVEDAADALAGKLNEDYDGYSDVRREAMHAIGMIGPAAKKVIPKLARGLTDYQQYSEEHHMVRAAAAWACGRMGPLAAEHMDRLITMLQAEGETTPTVVEAIGNIGPINDNVVANILTKMEMSTSWQTQSWVALQKFGTKAESVVPFAKRFLGRATFYGSGNSRAREALVIEVMKFLRVAGPSAATAIPELENLANYKYPYNEEDDMTPVMRKAAAETLAIIKGQPLPAGGDATKDGAKK